MERHNLGEKLFNEINKYLQSQDLVLREGSIISAPTSTKKTSRRDTERHQTKKGNQWHSRMKLHIGVDDPLGLIHSLATTSTNLHDIILASKLLHGKKECVWGDAGYKGIEKREEHQHHNVDWFFALRPSTRRLLTKSSAAAKAAFKKVKIRAKVKHPFRYINKGLWLRQSTLSRARQKHQPIIRIGLIYQPYGEQEISADLGSLHLLSAKWRVTDLKRTKYCPINSICTNYFLNRLNKQVDQSLPNTRISGPYSHKMKGNESMFRIGEFLDL